MLKTKFSSKATSVLKTFIKFIKDKNNKVWEIANT